MSLQHTFYDLAANRLYTTEEINIACFCGPHNSGAGMHTYTGTVKNVYIPTLIRLNMIQAYEGFASPAGPGIRKK